MRNVGSRVLLVAAAMLGFLLAGCAADRLKATAPMETSATYAPPRALQEVSVEYVGGSFTLISTTYGHMDSLTKSQSERLVKDILVGAGEVVPSRLREDLSSLSVGPGTRYKLTITPVRAEFLKQGAGNMAADVAFSVVLTDSSHQKLWEMTHVVFATWGRDLSDPMRAFSNAVMERLIVQGWIHATPSQAIAFASIDDVYALPTSREAVRDAYREWLTRQWPRAFVVADEGHYNAEWGGSDPAGRALAACRARGRVNCILYAVNDKIVYAPKP